MPTAAHYPRACRTRSRCAPGRNWPRERLVRMGSPIEEIYWTAKEWSIRTRVPYRTILAAAARGELDAVRPSGRSHGCILISERGWDAWMRGSRLRSRHLAGVGARQTAETRSLADLALR